MATAILCSTEALYQAMRHPLFAEHVALSFRAMGRTTLHERICAAIDDAVADLAHADPSEVHFDDEGRAIKQ